MRVWLEFLLASGIVILAGSRLARVGDKLGEIKGWERTWVGIILLSFSTSLPELFTSVSAAGIEKQADLAIGNNFGSIAFNLFLISILDLVEGKGAFLYKLNPNLIFSGMFSLLLMIMLTIFLWLKFPVGLWNIGIDTFTIFLLYFLALRLIYLHQGKNNSPPASFPKPKKEKSKNLWGEYFLCALAILGGGIWLAHSGEGIAKTTPISRTFVGTLFLAAATSLPELSTTLGALRIKALDMAVGNILGANLLNLQIPFWADIFYRRGNILSAASSSHLLTLHMSMIMTSLLIMGIAYRSKKSFLRLGWDSICILGVYLLGMYLLYQGGR